MRRSTLFTSIALAFASGVAAQTAAPAGNGPYAAPLAATYSSLTNAAHKIVVAETLAGQPVVIYDQQTFALLPSYPVAVDQLRGAMTNLCTTAVKSASVATPKAIALSVDIGGAASGLAALITALTPSYAIQGQAVTFDNSALVAAVAREIGPYVIFPSYLPPAAKQHDLVCGSNNYKTSVSVVDLWYGSLTAAQEAGPRVAQLPEASDGEKAIKKAEQGKLDAFQKLADVFMAADKGPSLLSRLLVAESLLRAIQASSPMSVLDLRLDAAGLDSSTKTILWWKKTKFNTTLMAHYTKLTASASVSATNLNINLTPVSTHSVIILSRYPKEEAYGTSEAGAHPVNQVR